jgi:hypothetical protein
MRRNLLLLSVIAILLSATGACGQILFEQDFDDDDATGFVTFDPRWSVTPSGEYFIDNAGYEIFAWSYAGDPSWSDYIYSYDLMSMESVNQLAAFRVQSPGNAYAVNMRAAPWNDIVLTKWVNGTEQHLLFWPFTNRNAVWHHYDIKVAGREISFYVDEEHIFTYVDASSSPYLTGGIAAVSYSGGVVRRQKLFLDNVVVDGGVVALETASFSDVKLRYR